MAFTLPTLPYALDALEPHISKETLEFHYGKHHNAYITKLNSLIAGTEHESKDLLSIIRASTGGVFNNAAQTWNHSFYWESITPNKTEPSDALTQKIVATFGSMDDFKAKFIDSAINNFGSGWTWLVKNKQTNELSIVNTSNADTPVTSVDAIPLFTADVWEHAYYIDYRNLRPDYLKNFWEIINWEFASNNYNS